MNTEKIETGLYDGAFGEFTEQGYIAVADNSPSEGLKIIFDLEQKPKLLYLGKSEQWKNRAEFWYTYNQDAFMVINS